MSAEPYKPHASVLLPEVVAAASVVYEQYCDAKPFRILDCTFGFGGHSRALLDAFPKAELVAIDRDAEALAQAPHRLSGFEGRFQCIHSTFAEVSGRWDEAPFQFLLADFGVSSHQFDEGERGFSLRHDGPLDMRMNPSEGEPLAALLEDVKPKFLARVLAKYGDVHSALPMARAILEAKPQSTRELAELVVQRTPMRFRHRKTHPATKVFQALRIWVNDELGEIERLLDALPGLLAVGAKVALISFHSLEDRLVKRAFRALASPCICPPSMPVCGCGAKPSLLLDAANPIVPSESECMMNPRARSAKMRIAQRV